MYNPTTLLTSTIIILSLLSPTLSIPVNFLSLTTRATCSPEVEALVSGINKNIDVQKQEQSQATVITSILAANTVDANDFKSAKGKLVDIVNSGAKIRANNQKIAPAGNAAIAGLGKVQMAQATELKMVQALTGKPETDNPNLKTLQGMFAGGIKQNQQNAKDAVKGCTL
ncbi:hypothetical protein BGZ60DRAFT_527691 [Tricladium varicosporioides]|nr:hypothetical protein BGZ60DRAFT_527691 [Hymenoscyphus varicosporioides]